MKAQAIAIQVCSCKECEHCHRCLLIYRNTDAFLSQMYSSQTGPPQAPASERSMGHPNFPVYRQIWSQMLIQAV